MFMFVCCDSELCSSSDFCKVSEFIGLGEDVGKVGCKWKFVEWDEEINDGSEGEELEGDEMEVENLVNYKLWVFFVVFFIFDYF